MALGNLFLMRSTGVVKPHARRTAGLVAVLAALMGVGACGDGSTSGDTTSGSDTTSTTPQLDTGDVAGAWVDPRDDTHLLLQVVGCIDDVTPRAVESTTEVRVSVTATEMEPPCSRLPIDLYLDAPLAGRRVIEADHGTELDVIPAEFLYTDPATLVDAECTEEAASRAVEHDVDGGLRTSLLACDATWMAVDTSTNACPATDEAPEDGCIGNHHIVYFRNDDGHWAVAFFDDCDVGRDRYPDFPAEICQS